ncbi:hypothetical protein F5I97DRAFT_1970515 [Phlebopus sp. FC_14]|nr:hypothetical protein F5I97DRAFT_1970515 [Phlebopus sp. FC_14]
MTTDADTNGILNPDLSDDANELDETNSSFRLVTRKPVQSNSSKFWNYMDYMLDLVHESVRKDVTSKEDYEKAIYRLVREPTPSQSSWSLNPTRGKDAQPALSNERSFSSSYEMIRHHEPELLSSQSPQHYLLLHPDLPSFSRVHVLSYVHVFHNRLAPITELCGDEFLRAWWVLVEGHLALWKNGVQHRDISPSKLMYYRDRNGNVVGVLIDFDLASTGGAQRITGAAPFMALDLLTDKALRGEVTHLYEHDAESFIWVLTWISLCYSDGKPLKNAELDKWLRVDTLRCGEKKWAFLFQSRSLHRNKAYPPGKGHEFHLKMVYVYLGALIRRSAKPTPDPWHKEPEKPITPPEKPETVFKELFVDPIPEESRKSVFVGMLRVFKDSVEKELTT